MSGMYKKGVVLWIFALAAGAIVSVLVFWSPSPTLVSDHQRVLVKGPGVETLALTCTGCHGPGGVSSGSIPSLAGRSADALAADMYIFRDGGRSGTIMKRFMVAFSDDDIVALAAYFSAQPFPHSEAGSPDFHSLP